MEYVNSVLGPIKPQALGRTLIHEHLLAAYTGWQMDAIAEPYDQEKYARICIKAIEEAKEFGVKTIVDATPNDGYRDPELYKTVSLETGVNIICSTGFYSEPLGATGYFKHRYGLSGDSTRIVKEMYEILMKEISDGIGGSTVKPGVIKVGSSKGEITPYEQMVFEAAARAHKESGLPIITHTDAGTMGPQQAQFLISRGVDPKRLMIGHMCGSANILYHMEVLKQGVYVSFDRFGLSPIMPDTIRTATIIALVSLGYENKIMMSHDSCMNWLGQAPPFPEAIRPLLANWNLTNIFKNILPALRGAHITEEQINTIMVANPRRLFADD